MPPKRKASAAVGGSRKRQTTLTRTLGISTSTDTIGTGSTTAAIPPQSIPSIPQTSNDDEVILREFYPPEIPNSRCYKYLTGALQLPHEVLQSALLATSSSRSKIPVFAAVIHWFRTDLRISDNTALSHASLKLQSTNSEAALIGLYVVSPEDFVAHVTSPARVDFILRSLHKLQVALEEKNIPLHVITVEKRAEVPDKILQLAKKWNANHIFANIEYEVDELRRDAALVTKAAEEGVDFCVLHDTCIVPPGKLHAKSSGKPFAVFTPWYRAWLAYIAVNREVLMLHSPPAQNAPGVRESFSELFGSRIPETPEGKRFSVADKKHVEKMFPAGEAAGLERLEEFIASRITRYKADRDTPSLNGTSGLSVHFAAGTLSSRTAIVKAAETNGGRLGTGGEGVVCWISEVGWRDFYRHVLVGWPFVCMNKPFKPVLSHLPWSTSIPHFTAWKTGTTGYPLVDAAMRQLNKTKWMHNRLRMVVASFLVKDLHIDWRKGEKYFMEQLIDGDFASNNGGWGWCAGTGVDPMPYFRVFNPNEQGKKWDPNGEFVRTWVEELKGVEGARVWELGEGERRRLGYPGEVVKHAEVKGWMGGVVKGLKEEEKKKKEKVKVRKGK